jgi:hypothetical protein
MEATARDWAEGQVNRQEAVPSHSSGNSPNSLLSISLIVASFRLRVLEMLSTSLHLSSSRMCITLLLVVGLLCAQHLARPLHREVPDVEVGGLLVLELREPSVDIGQLPREPLKVAPSPLDLPDAVHQPGHVPGELWGEGLEVQEALHVAVGGGKADGEQHDFSIYLRCIGRIYILPANNLI